MGRLTRPHWHWIDPTHQTKEHTLTCDMAHMGSAHHHITTTLEHCPQLSKPSIHVFVPIIRVYVHVHIASVPSSGRVHSRLGPRPLVRRPATLRGDDGCGECRGALIAPSPLAVVAGRFGAHLRALAPTRRRFGRGGSSPLVFLHFVGEALCRAKRGPWGRGQWGDGHRGGSDPMCGQGSRSGCVDSQQRE